MALLAWLRVVCALGVALLRVLYGSARIRSGPSSPGSVPVLGPVSFPDSSGGRGRVPPAPRMRLYIVSAACAICDSTG